MGQILQWPHYAYLRDNTEVLLPESEATYEFIEKMIKAAASPFRSKRIHLGMDEVKVMPFSLIFDWSLNYPDFFQRHTV